MSDYKNESKHSHQQDILQLQQLGLLKAAASNTEMTANTDDDADDTPWFLQLFFGFSGFVASFFFIGFLSLLLSETGVFDSVIATFIIGLLLSGVGFVVFKNQRLRRSTFMSSLAFSISVAGQIYVTFAIFISDISHPANVWLFLLIQALLGAVMPSFIYRLLSSVVVLSCVIYLLNFYHIPELGLGLLASITVVTSLQRYELLQYIPAKWRINMLELSQAVAYASAFLLLIFSVVIVAREYGHLFMNTNDPLIYNYLLAQTLLVLVSLYAAYLLLKRYNIALLSTLALIVIAIVTLLGMLSFYVAGLLATSIIIVIGMANSQRVLLSMGILALVSYIFWYYYQLDTSLLIKSTSMLIISLALLLIRWLLLKRYVARRQDIAINSIQEDKL